MFMLQSAFYMTVKHWEFVGWELGPWSELLGWQCLNAKQQTLQDRSRHMKFMFVAALETLSGFGVQKH